jgi:hypothetical protein
METTWRSQRSGITYTVTRIGNSFNCNCPSCENGVQCWNCSRIQGEHEYKRMVESYKPKPTVKPKWYSEFPELVPWDCSSRVVLAWQSLWQKQYCVKCY